VLKHITLPHIRKLFITNVCHAGGGRARMDSTVVSLLRCLPAGRRAHRAPAGRQASPAFLAILS
jgi:hypothetical protein